MTSSAVKQYYQSTAIANSYDRERFSSLVGNVFNRLEKHALQRVVGRAVRQCQTARVLDTACGTGRISELLLDMGLDVVGGDISEEMMAVARQRCQRFGDRSAFRRLDLDNPDIPAGSFELVTCIRLMHHLDSADRERIFKSLAHISSRFVIVNVSFLSPFYRLRRRMKRLLGQGISRAGSTWAEIQRETSNAGLTVVGRSFVFRYLSEDMVLLLRKE